jgi:hypothetical protein
MEIIRANSITLPKETNYGFSVLYKGKLDEYEAKVVIVGIFVYCVGQIFQDMNYQRLG